MREGEYRFRKEKQILVVVLVLAGLIVAELAFAVHNAPSDEVSTSTEVGIEAEGLPVVGMANASINEIEKTEIDTDGDGLSDYEEKQLGTELNSSDTDNDWISDKVETEIGTDPTKLDTDGDGIDDFNEYYTYPDLLNPNDPTDAERFRRMIPNVEAMPWKLETGGNFSRQQYYQKMMEIAKRDPLVQWYAEHIEVEWYEPGTLGMGETEAGYRFGALTVDGDFKKVGGYIHIGYEVDEYLQDLAEGRSHPAYFFTHQGRGMCAIQAPAFGTVFELKGYQVIFLDNIHHIMIEIFKDGESFIVSNRVTMASEDWFKCYNGSSRTNYTAWTAEEYR